MKFDDKQLENLEQISKNFEALKEFCHRLVSRDKIGNQRIYNYLKA